MLPLLFALLLPLSAEAAFVCPNSPVNLTATFFIPQAAVAPGSTCRFSILYNPISLFNSTFALLNIATANKNAGDSVVLTDSFGNVIDITSLTQQVAVPPPSLTLIINAGPTSTMTLGITATAKRFYPFNTRQSYYTVGTNTAAQFIDPRAMVPQQYNAIQSHGNGVFLAVAAQVGIDSALLMNAFVYDGINTGATLLGTLYNVFTNAQTVSKQGVFTIYCAANTNLDGLVMAIDQSNVGQFASYSVLWADFDSAPSQSIAMTSGAGRTALTILSKMDHSDPIYVTGVTTNTYLNAYAQTPLADNSSWPLFYEYSNNNQGLPQLFDSFAQTFVLEKGTAVLQYTTNKTQSLDSVAYRNRVGFIASQDYQLLASNQFSSVQDFHADFQFSVTLMAMQKPAPLTILNVHDYDTLTTDFFPIQNATQQITVKGRNLGIWLTSQYTNPNTGTLVYYVVIETNHTATLPCVGGNTKTPTPPPQTESTTNGGLAAIYVTSLLLATYRFALL